MFKYQIGYTSCEESDFIELEHEKKFTHEELLQMVAEATYDVYLKAVGHEYEKGSTTFEDIMMNAYRPEGIGLGETLCQKFGFKFVEYAGSVSVFGWARILDKDSWRSYRDEKDDLDVIREYIEKKLEVK